MAGPEAVRIGNTVLVLLAAGRGSRFGDTDRKLEQDLLGRPLGLHVAAALEDMPFLARMVVTGSAKLDYRHHGYEVLRNADPDEGMARSVRIGVEAAEKCDAQGVLIALADMPCVTAAHVRRLFDAATGADTVVASSDGRASRPPALFGRGRFAFLRSLEGDAGARDMIRAGRAVAATAAELVDVDTRGELEALRDLVSPPGAIDRRAGSPGS
ncbi:nucleotidyltransferase family protein [Sphingomonas bacterium]|uniref:nucleotidyltransferase family protein n=1 Tax=Sphingomonas bacterium TaxID=1895847 RepID=UPI0015758687|nr:nucleotidyltransferase family protein [Sphingomonas bacterium]